jgi:hypothetical protein
MLCIFTLSKFRFMRIAFALLLMALPACLVAQDSTVRYITKTGKETTIKDSAARYLVITKQGSLWYGKCYYTKNNVLQSQGAYLKPDMLTPTGRFDNYNEEGILDNTSVYDDKGERVSRTTYYPSGKKRSYISYGKNGDTFQEGWDEEGKSIPGYVVYREAAFNGGTGAWSRYIASHLKAEVPAEAGAPAGTYRVIVSFEIDKEGNITEVKADSIPPLCHECAAEATRVIRTAPRWQPAIQYNEPTIQPMRQPVTFVVEEDKKAKRKRDLPK